MKKVLISIAALFGLWYAKAQDKAINEKSRTLSFEEANLVSSYYNQNGNNSAVTGGIGTEKLSDISNSIDVVLVKYDKKGRKKERMAVWHPVYRESDILDVAAAGLSRD